MKTRITIQDVAQRAQVSQVTVSYVLNGRDADARISPDTRDRVLEAARELGYRANAVARMLVTRKSQAIAVVFQYASYFGHWSSFISSVMHGVSEAAVEADFDLMLHTRVARNSNHEMSQLLDGRVDGALLLRDANDPLITELLRRDFPMVLFFTRSYSGDVAYVDADNYSGGRMAAQHLLELGHENIAMVRGSSQSTASNDRFSGYRDALESAGQSVRPESVLTIATPTDDLTEFVSLMSSPDRPTAILVWSDDVAYQLMAQMKAMGISIPRDVSIIGFDSLDSSNLISPGLTSVRQPIVQMAKEAATMLIDQIEGRPMQRKQVIYPLSLDVRDSTAVVPH